MRQGTICSAAVVAAVVLAVACGTDGEAPRTDMPIASDAGGRLLRLNEPATVHSSNGERIEVTVLKFVDPVPAEELLDGVPGSRDVAVYMRVRNVDSRPWNGQSGYPEQGVTLVAADGEAFPNGECSLAPRLCDVKVHPDEQQTGYVSQKVPEEAVIVKVRVELGGDNFAVWSIE